MFKKVILSCFVFFSTLTIFSCSVFADDSNFSDDYEKSDEEFVSDCIASSSDSNTSDTAPTINSRSAVVIDRASQTILFGKNEFNKVKMASTTKIMTALVVIENCDLKEIVTVSKKAAGTGGSRLGLKAGDKCSVNDLLYGLMLCSGNDAAVALAEHVGGSVDSFANIMNNKALELNLKNTHFVTPHGLDKDNHYTTAYELAVLSNFALKNKTFANIVNTKTTTITINNFPRNLHNTNELLGNLNGVYGVKTGFTNGANRCLVSACKRGDLDIICVVLGADTKKFRTTDSIKLIEYSFKNFAPVNVSEIVCTEFDNWKNNDLVLFDIYKPSSKSSDLSLSLSPEDSDVVIPIKNSEIEHIATDIYCETNIIPPVYNGSVLGSIRVSSQGHILYSRDILLSSDIYSKSFIEFFIDILKRLNFEFIKI